MEKKGQSNVRTYIAVVVILVCALIFIFYLLETEKARLEAKPMTEEVTKSTVSTTVTPGESTSTTTIAIYNNEGVTTPINVEPVSNFDASLSDIIGNLSFFADYNVTTFYHGVEFTFKCTDYDTSTGICTGGSGLMKVNDALFPLYTYNEPSGNFLLRGDDYYILLNDEMVILYTSNIGVTGVARIFDLRGTQVGTINNTLTSYKFKDKTFKRLYPNIEDNKIYYYSCVNNQVVINASTLGEYDNVELYESVEGSCF